MKNVSFDLTVNSTNDAGVKSEAWKGSVEHIEPESLDDLRELINSGKYSEKSVLAVFNAGDRVARQTRLRPVILKSIADGAAFDASELNMALDMSESAIRAKSSPFEKITKSVANLDPATLTEAQKAELRAKLGL